MPTADKLAALIVAVAVTAHTPAAGACAACACGDSTLTGVGIEKPYKNRVRLGLEERVGTFAVGDATSGEHATVLRSSLSLSWIPHVRVQLAVVLPWFDSWIQSTTAGPQQLNGLGDLEASTRVLLFRDRGFSPHHLLWASAGLKMPTGPRLRDGSGYPYADDDQPGSGSWDPFGAVTYGWFSGDLTSVFASTGYRYNTRGPRGHQFGSSLLSSATVQLQPYAWGALQLGAEVRWAESDTLPNGAAVPNSGGTVAYFSPALLANPWRNLLLRLGVQVPVVQRLHGIQNEGPRVMLSLAYDIR